MKSKHLWLLCVLLLGLAVMIVIMVNVSSAPATVAVEWGDAPAKPDTAPVNPPVEPVKSVGPVAVEWGDRIRRP